MSFYGDIMHLRQMFSSTQDVMFAGVGVFRTQPDFPNSRWRVFLFFYFGTDTNRFDLHRPSPQVIGQSHITTVCHVIIIFPIVLSMSQLRSRFSEQQLLLPTLLFQYEVYKTETPTVSGKCGSITIGTRGDSDATRPFFIYFRFSPLVAPSLW